MQPVYSTDQAKWAEPERHPANDELNNYTNQGHQHKKWTKEDYKLPLHYYSFYITQHKESRKIYATFQTISLRLTDQVWTIRKKGWFSDLEILEIHQKINRESNQQYPNTIIDTPNSEQ